MTNKIALRAVSQLAHIDIPSAVRVVRLHPLLEDEIHIEEELINYQESMQSYHQMNTLQNYPEIRAHALAEKRLILKHCVGLIVRMLYKKRLPRYYTAEDTAFALKKLTRLVIEDAYRTGKKIDIGILKSVWPLLGWRQRAVLRERRGLPGKTLSGMLRHPAAHRILLLPYPKA